MSKERLYDEYVSSGQAGDVSVSKGRMVEVEKIVDKFIPKKKGTSIIDLGCGYGIYMKELLDRGYKNVKGVDISEEQVEAARRNGVENVFHGEAEHFLEGEASGSVDVVLMVDIIEHMELKKMLSVLGESNRVLSEGGRCIIHVPNAQGIFGMRVRYGDLTHERAFSPKSIEQLLRTTGFTSINIYEDKPVVHGALSLGRRLLWEVITLVPKLLLLVESPGAKSFAMSQNILITATKKAKEGEQ
ncbi:class I SAM-dependent methyltransferase [Salinibacter sp.]|uniref:class I SAM-dependent methyltransferase n=1 Tax=Salinibacter sp. TaxID=2065818 RepID=UPI0021E78722|nr:class I SAM-dependent methyltransferase [Salinibacter sp.]